MKWFSRRKDPDMPPLVPPPKAGEPIKFDDEEERNIDRLLSRIGNVSLPAEEQKEFQDGLAASALQEVARSRIRNGDLKGAASACVKAISFWQSSISWLLLSQAYAEHGDYQMCDFDALNGMVEMSTRK